MKARNDGLLQRRRGRNGPGEFGAGVSKIVPVPPWPPWIREVITDIATHEKAVAINSPVSSRARTEALRSVAAAALNQLSREHATARLDLDEEEFVQMNGGPPAIETKTQT